MLVLVVSPVMEFVLWLDSVLTVASSGMAGGLPLTSVTVVVTDTLPPFGPVNAAIWLALIHISRASNRDMPFL